MFRITGNEVQNLMEAYNAVYAPQELTEDQIWEEVENWVNSLLEEGYDLSEYTWEEMYESYLSEAPMTAFQAAGGQAKLDQLNKNRSPRSGRVTASQLERQGQQNLYKAGGGDAAIAKGPTRAQNVRGGGQRQVPTLTRQDIINRGATAAGSGSNPRPAATAARPAASTPAPRPATTKTTPTSAPAAKPATSLQTAASNLSGTGALASAPKQPSISSGIADLRKMRMASQMRQSGANVTSTQLASFDMFDVVKAHLLDEGYADTEEAALVIMANMSEEWKESIVEQTPSFIEDLYDYKDGGGKAKEAQGMSKQSVIELGRKNRDRLTGLKGDDSRVGQALRRTYTQMGGDARARQLGVRPDGTYK